MKIPAAPHRWSVTPCEAIAIQRRLAGNVRVAPLRGGARLVAGIDLAFSPDGRRAVAAAVLWDAESQEVVEERLAVRTVRFPRRAVWSDTTKTRRRGVGRRLPSSTTRSGSEPCFAPGTG